VVTGDVAPYAVVGGNPAREIRRSAFPRTEIRRLLALRWWDWDAAKITRNVHLLTGGDIDALERAE
jgi:virginiamycin A acetyltransferase